MNRILHDGMKISFFGTEYTINRVLDYDKIEVIQNNGTPVVIWFPNLPGREILTKRN